MKVKMKKILFSVIIGISLFSLISTVCLAAYFSQIVVQNASSVTSYDMLGFTVQRDIEYMASEGYFDNIEGLDTRVRQGTTAQPHLLATDRINFATSLLAASSKALNFLTGESNLSNFQIIPGYSNNSSVGYIETADAPSIEIGDNGSVSMGGVYLSQSGNITEKGTSLCLAYDATSENVTAYIDFVEVIEEQFTTQNTDSQTIQGAGWRAIVFTPSSDYYISAVSIKARRILNPGIVTLTVRETTGGAPVTGIANDLGSGTTDGNSFGVGLEWHKIEFDNIVLLESGTSYAFTISARDGDAANEIVYGHDNAAGDADASGYITTDSATSWNLQAALDYPFKIYGFPPFLTATGVEKGKYDIEVDMGWIIE